MELSASHTNEKDEYYPKLTAVGYGEPTFAAFYPNCHSVFGFHDADSKSAPPAGVRYDVVGWYSASALDGSTAGGNARDGGADADHDFLQSFVAGKRANNGADAASLIASLEKEAGWTLALDDVVNWYEEEQHRKRA